MAVLAAPVEPRAEGDSPLEDWMVVREFILNYYNSENFFFYISILWKLELSSLAANQKKHMKVVWFVEIKVPCWVNRSAMGYHVLSAVIEGLPRGT